MEPLIIERKTDTPSVYFSKEENKFEIEGRSLPEDVNEFYDPVINWLKEYREQPNPKTVFVVKLDYYNSASSKMLSEIFEELETIQLKGSDILVEWHYNEDDEDMQYSGEEYSEIINIPFEFISYI
jgi:hypothetical protein